MWVGIIGKQTRMKFGRNLEQFNKDTPDYLGQKFGSGGQMRTAEWNMVHFTSPLKEVYATHVPSNEESPPAFKR